MYGRSWCRASWTACHASRSAPRRRKNPNRSGRSVADIGARRSGTGSHRRTRRRMPESARPIAPTGSISPTSDGGRYGVPPASSATTRAIVSRSSGRGTIRSTWPWRKFDSARPKSSGRLSRVVCFTTRGPENESSAPGSAMMTSPSAAKLAATPPVVGCTSTETNGPAGLLQLVDGRDGLRHLHQREHALLHARAARRGDRHQRQPPVEREVGGAHELLAHHRAHRPAQEGEVHHRRATPACRRSRRRRPRRRRADRSPASRPRPAPGTAASRRTRAGRTTRGRAATSANVPSSTSCTIRSRAVTGKW